MISIHPSSDSDLHQHPWAVVHLAMSYESLMLFQGPESACRGFRLGETEADDSDYHSHLRPGVMLISALTLTDEFLTTLGLPLRSISGNDSCR